MKKYIKTIILIILTFILGIINTNAATKDLELVDVKVQGKTASITVEDVALQGNTVTSKIAFNKLNDFVAFELTIKNNDDEEYKVASVEDNNTSENLEITYIYDNNYIKKDETTSVTVKFKYVKELLDKEKISLDNLNIKINFEKADGKTEEVVVNPTPTITTGTSSISTNPITGIPLLRYILIAILSTLGLVLVLAKKNKKIGTALLVLTVVAIPFVVLANQKFEISLKFSSVEVIGKEQTPPPTTATLVEGSQISSFTHNKEGIFRKATLEEYNSVKDTLTEENIISTEDSEKVVYIWDIDSGTLYYSEADTIYMNENSSYMFTENYYTSIDLRGLDSSKVTTMKGMFDCNPSLENLDITSFDTTNVTDMSYMFTDTLLEEIDISTFNTSNVTDMSYMFANNQELKTIYIFDEWDTSKVTNSERIFDNDELLVGEKTTVRNWMFSFYNYDQNYNDFDYAHLDGGPTNPGYLTLKGHNKDFSILLRGEYGFDEKNYAIAEGAKLFRKATTAEYNLVKDTLTDENVVSDIISPIPTYMWKDEEKDAALYYSTASIIYMNGDAGCMFESSQYETIDISGIDSSLVYNMWGLLRSSHSLKEIVFGNFNTSNVENFGSMFEDCENLSELDLSTFDTSNATSVERMFSNMEKLNTIYVSNKWDVSNVEYSSDMFDYAKNIIGEKLTVYDDNHLDVSYAHVDGGPSNPGYLTLKGHIKDFSILLPGYDYDNNYESDINVKLRGMNTKNKDFREATSAEYNSVKKSLTRDNIISIGSPEVYMWETTDSVLYYSEASAIYLNSNSEYMFSETEFKTIDLSGFETTFLKETSSMFAWCMYLSTIYVSDTWDMSNVESSYDMFIVAYNLVGEQFTMYDGDHYDGEYAHVDGGSSDPGYLTLKGHDRDYAILRPGYNHNYLSNYDGINEKLKNMDTTNKEFRKATIEEYNLVEDTLTDDNVISMGSPEVYMWETTDSVLYYSEASTIYLNSHTEYMFSGLDFKTIDLSDFDTTLVILSYEMLSRCDNLTTVYVSNTWDLSNVEDSSDMFYGTYNLIGELGTINYEDDYNFGASYAHVDGGSSDPGYLTLKGHTKDFAIMIGGDYYNNGEPKLNDKLIAMNTANKEFRKATTTEYNSEKEFLTDDNIVSTSNSPIEVYMWETTENILYYSSAPIIYLNRDSSEMFKETELKTIDLSDFDTTITTNMYEAFYNCNKLVTIYVSNTWDVSRVDNWSYAFVTTYNLVGEKGTIVGDYDEYEDYVHVDEGPSNPGYLTLKGHTKDFAILLEGDTFNDKIKAMNTTNKDFRKATLEEYNSVKNLLTPANIVSGYNSPTEIYMWETTDSILYYSSVSKIYLYKFSGNLFADTGLKTIDVSGFDARYTIYIENIFSGCENLTTIYAQEGWYNCDAENWWMFRSSPNIVGGQGTTYDEDHTEGDWAHIDGGPSNPGYFTDVANKP